ncbi:hypothetical protein LshimejAT787_1100800 [Lyophyllum shimeji]|uniref:Uncharacterized protein n=1 Tax=Lyophyllum shimeji TaxID=47721 RepID=A0A9P3PU83_LYOSH|nr:hypothetical protein LshimejAT787_1100800 [Lyophyllum shimeji]
MLFHVRSASASAPPSPRPSPPSSPSRSISLGVGSVADMFLKMRNAQDRAKAHHIESSSGLPQSHQAVAENASGKGGPYELSETFVCTDAVNMFTLLGATRDALLKYAKSFGANCLVDEEWQYTICGPKHHTYRVHISYKACTVRSTASDPHKPVSLDKVKNVPGCMTILHRNAS